MIFSETIKPKTLYIDITSEEGSYEKFYYMKLSYVKTVSEDRIDFNNIYYFYDDIIHDLGCLEKNQYYSYIHNRQYILKEYNENNLNLCKKKFRKTLIELYNYSIDNIPELKRIQRANKLKNIL